VRGWARVSPTTPGEGGRTTRLGFPPLSHSLSLSLWEYGSVGGGRIGVLGVVAATQKRLAKSNQWVPFALNFVPGRKLTKT
jgi:hypothetical protein